MLNNEIERRIFEIGYTLSKQLPSIQHIETNYGDIKITEEMRKVIIKSISALLKRELATLERNQKRLCDKTKKKGLNIC